ncbi:hypothetical protein CDAR_582481 [Caerostris darwini]|uniref:Uncharacterized protein n=1 Tax=Caerostris darwini TaxID=1538125 RepID=A0AAV4RIU9_9ARAC|nr:hypothetical protein CDAR_582481 [Caerostris darwini]
MHENNNSIFDFKKLKRNSAIQKLDEELLLELEAVQRPVVDKVSSKEIRASNKLPGKRRLELEAVQRLVVDKVSSKEMHASNESFIFSSSHSRVKTRSPFATHNRLLCFNRLCFRKHFPESASNRVQQHFGKKR